MIILTNLTNFEINNEFWKIIKLETHLSSQTNTSIPHVGYGGIGIILEINSQFYKYNELEATIYKNNSNYFYKSDIAPNNKCTLIPMGGDLNDYSIVIEQKRINSNTN